VRTEWIDLTEDSIHLRALVIMVMNVWGDIQGGWVLRYFWPGVKASAGPRQRMWSEPGPNNCSHVPTPLYNNFLEVLASNLGRSTVYRCRGSSWFPSVAPHNYSDIISIKPELLPSKFFSVYCWSIFLSFSYGTRGSQFLRGEGRQKTVLRRKHLRLNQLKNCFYWSP
jgi:hypothetical protein